MGAWGCGPYDNDTAADWFYGLDDTGIYDLIENGLASESYQEQRAAAWLVQRLTAAYDIDKIDKHGALAVSKLEAILNDDKWLDSWRDRNEIVAKLKQQIDEIKNPDTSSGLMEKICSSVAGVSDEDTEKVESTMKLWVLDSTEHGFQLQGYDCYNGFVIEAVSEERAREIAAGRSADEGKEFWTDPECSNCEELKPNGEEGIKIGSFNAG